MNAGHPKHLYKVIKDLTYLIGPGGHRIEIHLDRGDLVEISVADPADLPSLEYLLSARVIDGPSRGRTFNPHVMDLGSKLAPLSPLECLAWAAEAP